MFDAGGSSSTYHRLDYTARRVYFETGAGGTVQVQLRSVVEVWHQLEIESLALLSVNCEGCEYDILPALAESGLIARVQVITLQSHMILTTSEKLGSLYSEEQLITGNVSGFNNDLFCVGCVNAPVAEAIAIGRYCSLSGVLSKTHERFYGVPFHKQEYWRLSGS